MKPSILYGALAAALTCACSNPATETLPTDSRAAADGRSTDQSMPRDAAEAGVADTLVGPVVPAEGWIVFESYREAGRPEIYRMRADGSEVVRLTTEGGKMPRWSPDGSWVVYEDLTTTYARRMRPDGSANEPLFEGLPAFWMPDGSGMVCAQGASYYVVDPLSREPHLLFAQNEFQKLGNKVLQPGGISADGRYMVAGTDRYRDGFVGDNGSFKASWAAIVLDLEDKTKLYYFGGGCAPRTAPAGEWIYHVCGDCPTKPDIYRMKLSDLASRESYAPLVAYPDADWGHEYFPKISNDNQWLVYGASTGCHDQAICDYEIFIHRLGAPKDQRHRLTAHPSNDRSPDLFVGPLWSAH